MRTLLIGYDLNRPGQDYAGLISTIKELGGWRHCLDSTWIVRTDLGPKQARDRLKRQIDQTDELLVIEVTGQAWAGTGFDEAAYEWFHQHL
ncbi:MAG: hypothetical protein JW940_21705 [Polyangiaceae bacterium]|nr:hypothetical protein [Polyangiaceae bacterium]